MSGKTEKIVNGVRELNATTKTSSWWYLKKPASFYDSNAMKAVQSLGFPKNVYFTYVYERMLTLSIPNEGYLRYSLTQPMTPQRLSWIIGMPEDIVKEAYDFLGLLEVADVYDNQTMFLIETIGMIGNETLAAIKMEKWRNENEARLLKNNTLYISEREDPQSDETSEDDTKGVKK